jgi:predicted acyltransferase
MKPSPTLETTFDTASAPTEPNTSSPISSPTSSRSVALDALRGLTVALMLLVNNIALGEFTPAQLQHAPWGAGVHLADLVFPWFLFCAGSAVPFSWAAACKRRSSRWDWSRRAMQRATILFTIGCFLTSVINHAPTISLGVLQLIGLAGLIAALLEPERPVVRGSLAFVLLFGYWAFLRFTPIAGLEPGTFEPGRNPAANLNLWLDPYGLRGLPSLIPTAALMLIASLIGSLLLQPAPGPHSVSSAGSRLGSIWGSSKAARLIIFGVGLTVLGILWNLDLEFNKPHWTPAYILFTAGTAALMLIASLISSLLLQPAPGPRSVSSAGSRLGSIWGSSKAARLIIFGVGLTVLGILWNLDLEFNKPHWTPAYILFTAGTAALMLGAMTMLEMRLGSGIFWTLTVFGSNALLGYVAPILFKTWVLQDWLVLGQSLQDQWLASLVRSLGRVLGGWAYTFGYILACWLVLYWLYRKRIFWRV